MNYLTTPPTQKQIEKLREELPQALILHGRSHDYLLPIARTIAHAHTTHIFTLTPSEGRQAIAIAQVRSIITATATASISEQPRVYIFADNVSHDAYHALLKLLEEAPQNCHFILLTTSLHEVPPTIISRCQRLHVTTPTARDIELAAHQKGILDEATIKQLLFIADILPEDLPQLIAHPERMKTVAEKVVEAKNFLTASRQERFRIIKKHQTKKDTLLDFIITLGAIIARHAQSQPDILKKSTTITASVNALEENASPKLIAAYVAWRV